MEETDNQEVNVMFKYLVLCALMVLLLIPGVALTAILNPCTVIAFANGNAYIQSPSYSQSLYFDSMVSVANCDVNNLLKTATVTVANPPQNPPPTAPVYLALSDGTTTTTQLLLMQGTTVITQADFTSWFPSTLTPTTPLSFDRVVVTCPSTPWVPASITIIWQ